jgi:signal peptidase I
MASSIAWDAGFGPSPDGQLLPAAPVPAPPRRVARELVVFVLLALAFLLVFRGFIAEARWIPSGSMQSQLEIDDRVLVSKMAYRLHPVHRGDIVVFPKPVLAGETPPPHPILPIRWLRSLAEGFALVKPLREDYIKRVVGLPGETVEGRNGHVYIEGRQLLEPYLDPGAVTDDFGPVIVPDGTIWVMGDNRRNSSDSRVIGVISIDSLLGRAVVRMWPPQRASFL